MLNNLSGSRFGRARANGWVSLPIILLLFSIALLSTAFYLAVAESRRWVALQAPYEQQQQLWASFQNTQLLSLDLTRAQLSQCGGFCQISGTMTLPYSTKLLDSNIVWRLDYYPASLDNRYYRLCAKQADSLGTQGMHCWWYQQQGQRLRYINHIGLNE